VLYVFGLSFGELVVLVVVAVVVIGPRDLPRMLRKAGQWAGKLRRMASDLRTQSGIDDVLREGDLGPSLQEIRKLARGELDGVMSAASITAADRPASADPAGAPPFALAAAPADRGGDAYDDVERVMARDREYPRDGADSYGALPDTALVYGNTLPESKLAKDPLYAEGRFAVEAPVEASIHEAEAS